ncbi:DUF805 domain-containing protein [Galbibacter mesophilus]|uniref:DUF805 domain-containing protein n=1 Tax=Galbibacter mesophilus TaxID=379069 RepID=UPI00191E5F18|nr:DUF805 domain-containing protein [Galbibacter mesophilus]MCM5664292.1 DUF805 domain-containing protein [Galbibacter mesophilus]
MFKSPFSFDGRIRRTEYGLSILIYFIGYFLVFMLTALFTGFMELDATGATLLFWVFLVPILYFNIAQSAKRCHDLGNSGWYQLIPFYIFWLLFAEGQSGANEYGQNPKEINRFEEISEIGKA